MYLKEELEEILGLISNEDDYTSLLYKALKDSKDKKDLLKYSKLCTDENLRRRLDQIANRSTTPNDTGKKTDIRSSFEELLGAGLSKPLSGL